MTTTPSVVVVNYGSHRLLRDCLDSLAQGHSGADVVVVDNASPDDPRAMLRSDHPGVRLIALPANRGFGAAVNAGVGATSGEWVLVLNNDVVLAPGAARELLEVAQRAPSDVGCLAPQLRFADGSERINSAGLEIDMVGVARDRLLGSPGDDGGQPVEVFGVSAGAALYRRRMLDRIGGFDEGFFLYLEDADLAWRARMAGWRSLYVPAAVVHHVHSAASGHNSPFKHRYVGRNRVRLLARNADAALLRRRAPAMVAYDVAYVAYAVVADRTPAPLTGRLDGLRHWRAWRRAGAADRRPVALARPGGVRAALARRRAWLGRR